VVVDGQTLYGFACQYKGVAGPVGSNAVTGTAYNMIPGTYQIALDGIMTHVGTYNGKSYPVISTRSVTDGLSKTLMIGEASNLILTFGTWGLQDSWTIGCYTGANMHAAKNVKYAINSVATVGNDYPFCSYHNGGTHFATGDGAITFLNENIDMTTYRSLASRNGGETASLP
jgi:hypothetical protein